MERVLVTGGAGYVGTTVVPALLEAGYAVRVVDRFFFGRDLLRDHERLEIVQEDTRCLQPEHFRDVDYVIDFVGISNDPSGEMFQEQTWQINNRSRVRTAILAKSAGVKRYILPSSCSIYGFRPADVILEETSETNPLTTYAKANQKTEGEVFSLADDAFCVIVMRMATVFGLSPRMRFDLAINGMTFGAWRDGKIPLMRDGTQWRPMIHVKDVARAMLFMLDVDRDKVNGQIFNVGANEQNYQIGELAQTVSKALPIDVRTEWYGDPDHRSYRVSFDKIEKLGYKTMYDAAFGAREIYDALEAGQIERSTKTITLEWYQELTKWHRIIHNTEMYGGILSVDQEARARADKTLPQDIPDPADSVVHPIGDPATRRAN
jgi:nucleoside-diphosphate-sugar epimerase